MFLNSFRLRLLSLSSCIILLLHADLLDISMAANALNFFSLSVQLILTIVPKSFVYILFYYRRVLNDIGQQLPWVLKEKCL